jgi:hypothetical protein
VSGLIRRFINVSCLALLSGAIIFLFAGCGILDFGKTSEKHDPLTIKAEDFSVFLFESSEEIYRANVKSLAMWAGLKEQAERDPAYAPHYKWLYDTYNSWDENRKAQLHVIMQEYTPSPWRRSLSRKEARRGSG